MSKIGAYVIDQIERGNFTVDEGGNYRVPQPTADYLKNRERTITTREAAADSICKDEGRAKRNGSIECAEPSSDIEDACLSGKSKKR